MKKPRTIRLVALILLLLVLLPLLVFTVYEVSGSSASESFVTDVYRRQLDIVLFSINQFAWDVVNSWASNVENAWIPSDGSGTFPQAFAGEFLERNPAVDAVFLADSTGTKISFVAGNAGDVPVRRTSLESRLASEEPLVSRLLLLSRRNYRKIEPLIVKDSPDGAEGVVLLFVLRDLRGHPALAGLRLHPDKFVEKVLAERMREAAGAEFIITVTRKSNGERVFTSGEGAGAEAEQRRQLWLFPDLDAGISLRGETIQQLARSRVSRDMNILHILDVVLLVGAWFVYRSVKREMELVRLKSDFVSNVSHELRTPLALIRMYAETLEMGRLKGEEKRREYYATIVKEAERLTRLVNNLLNFSRMEAGRRPYDLSPLDLNEIVRGVLESFSPHLKNEGFTPIVDLDLDVPSVRADREAVQEALINLIDNAVKYSGSAKYLRVATGVRMDDVVVDVEDHGPGIAAEYRKQVFETFFRVPEMRTSGRTGSGLGLSIARHIMEAHGGRIDLKSTPGKGSTFTLAFRYEHDTRH